MNSEITKCKCQVHKDALKPFIDWVSGLNFKAVSDTDQFAMFITNNLSGTGGSWDGLRFTGAEIRAAVKAYQSECTCQQAWILCSERMPVAADGGRRGQVLWEYERPGGRTQIEVLHWAWATSINRLLAWTRLPPDPEDK